MSEPKSLRACEAAKVLDSIRRAAEMLPQLVRVEKVEMPTTEHRMPVLTIDGSPEQAGLDLQIRRITINRMSEGSCYGVTKIAKFPDVFCEITWHEDFEDERTAEVALPWSLLVSKEADRGVLPVEDREELEQLASSRSAETVDS